MKALTLRQPWAEAICRGWKVNETRSWGVPRYATLPMQIALHASSSMTASEREFGRQRRIISPPLGVVVAKATLVRCVRMTPEYIASIWEEELRWGNYAPGRWSWELALVQPLATPVPARGRLGLWEWAA